MKFNPKLRYQNLNISQKIGGSFLILIVLILLNAIYTVYTLSESTSVLNTISNELNPSLKKLAEFRDLVKDTKTYSTNWAYVPNYEEDKSLSGIHFFVSDQENR